MFLRVDSYVEHDSKTIFINEILSDDEYFFDLFVEKIKYVNFVMKRIGLYY